MVLKYSVNRKLLLSAIYNPINMQLYLLLWLLVYFEAFRPLYTSSWRTETAHIQLYMRSNYSSSEKTLICVVTGKMKLVQKFLERGVF